MDSSEMTGSESIARVLHADTPTQFVLVQAWAADPDPELRPTEVRVTFRDGALHVVAELEDDDIFNTATADNQRTWETGDVFEVFARRDDGQSYVEVHVTPDNVKLHLRFDDFEHLSRIADIDEVAADPAAIESSVSRSPRGWRVSVRVPLAAVPGDLVRVSFCRYDATRGRGEPVLSSSSPHPVLSFHRPLEWALCRIAD